MKDRYPRLPPGCTPSDIDRAMSGPKCPDCGRRQADGHHAFCRRRRGDDRDYCIVCNPPVPGRRRSAFVDHVDDLDALPYCDSHDVDDLRATLERDDERRQDGMDQSRFESTFFPDGS